MAKKVEKKKVKTAKSRAVAQPVVKVKPTAKAGPTVKVRPAAKARPTPAKVAAPEKAAKAPSKAAKPGKTLLASRDLEALKSVLLKMRERITGHISSLADDTLNRLDDTPMEDRTDDFDREFALNLVSSEHDAVYEINDALRRIAEHRYGRCELCDAAIEKARLHALPFAKLCVHCQSQSERGRTKFRPFGGSIYQAVERPAESGPAEPEENE